MAQSFIYLDHAAATPLDATVQAAMEPYFSAAFYNPSATYEPAVTVRQAVAAARLRVAHWLGARPAEVIFTAGGTEANNIAIHGVLRQFPDGNVVVSGIEHDSVLKPAHRYDCREVAVGPDGRLNLKDLATKIDEHTVLVSVMYANNEVGTIQPLKEVSRFVQERRQQRLAAGNQRPLYVHTDACQATNYLDLHTARLGVDLLTLNGGKIYGPKQSGALYVKAGVRLQPLIDGGGQEQGLRSGTENVPAIIGFAEALEQAQTRRHDEINRLAELQKQALKAIETQLPTAVVNGSLQQRLPNNLHLTLPGYDNERLLLQLEAAGVLAAAGSACSASNEESSHVLHAMGLDDAAARASLRLTMGRETTAEMINQTIATLQKLTTL
ncbi:MAG TPA: cysteine desulfurase family protein [Candidatus Saccharimonadales bacterium]|nr:cysteine desulfurase family protein [Candidatus Saccharimonadales bacterium]